MTFRGKVIGGGDLGKRKADGAGSTERVFWDNQIWIRVKRFAVPILVLICLALAGGLIFSFGSRAGLVEENRSLRLQMQNLTSRDSEPEAAPVKTEVVVDSAADAELIKLRGEVVTLRQEREELQRLREENQTLRTAQTAAAAARSPRTEGVAPLRLARENWTFAGYVTPEATFQSLLWAVAHGNTEAILAAMTPEQIAELRAEEGGNQTDAQIAAQLAKRIAPVKSFQVLTSEVSENAAVLTLFIEGLEGSEQTPKVKLQRIGNEWRLAVGKD